MPNLPSSKGDGGRYEEKCEHGAPWNGLLCVVCAEESRKRYETARRAATTGPRRLYD